MVNDEDYSDVIVRTELTGRTGEERWQTADGRWWRKWDGIVRTGQEVKELRKP